MPPTGNLELAVLHPPKGDVWNAECPHTRLILDRIGDKWTVLVVLSLDGGALRFSQLRKGIGRVTPKVLTQTLRTLERDGLVTRRIYPEIPPRVEYALTELGRTLLGPIREVRDWAEANAGAVVAARAAYDARAAGTLAG